MKKIIALELFDDIFFYGCIEGKKNYILFTLTEKDDYKEEKYKYNKKDYNDRYHFAGVMGKFDIDLFFLIKPFEIEDNEMNFYDLKKKYEKNINRSNI